MLFPQENVGASPLFFHLTHRPKDFMRIHGVSSMTSIKETGGKAADLATRRGLVYGVTVTRTYAFDQQH